MRRLFVILAAVTAVGCSVRDAFSGRVGVVAETENHQLTATELAALMAQGENIPLRRDVAERIAYVWLEYVLFADRVIDGDSLLDSATVLHTFWPEADQILINQYREHLMEERVTLDSATVDSAYRAGELRLIDHLLVRTTPDMSQADREAAFAKAERLHRLAVSGNWDQANQQSEDRGAQRAGGSLGVVHRGDMLPEVDTVAYSLQPGEISNVVESRRGYHVIRRRNLSEVREQFEAAVRQDVEAQTEDAFVKNLLDRWRVRVEASAPGNIREAGRAPLLAMQTPRVLATYRDGQLTTADLERWLHALPAQLSQGLAGATDDDLRQFTSDLVQREILAREAREAGFRVPDSVFTQFKARLSEDVDQVKRTLELDSIVALVVERPSRLVTAESAVESYLEQIAVTQRNAVVVPTFLADRLFSESKWEVSTQAVDQAVERAQRIRQEAMAETPTAADTSEDSSRGSDGGGDSDSR